MFNAHQDTTTVDTPRCLACGLTGTLRVSTAELRAWLDGGVSLQDAFPTLSLAHREQLKFGTHPDCWDTLLGPEPDDEDEPQAV